MYTTTIKNECIKREIPINEDFIYITVLEINKWKQIIYNPKWLKRWKNKYDKEFYFDI